MGGDKLPYPDDAGSPAANMLETKLLINSVISNAKKGARFLSVDLKDHFLNTPMSRPEYMRVHYRHLPLDIRKFYDLDKLITPDGICLHQNQKGYVRSSSGGNSSLQIH